MTQYTRIATLLTRKRGVTALEIITGAAQSAHTSGLPR